jgi:DNA-binding CsgD family transcriptional regulator
MTPNLTTNSNGQTRIRINTEFRRTDSTNLHPEPVRSSVAQPKLPPRQRAVVELVCRGLTDKEIAIDLGLSEETIGWYLKQVFPKFGVHTRTALILRCLHENNAATPNAPHERGDGKHSETLYREGKLLHLISTPQKDGT